MNVIETNSIVKRYRRVEALRNVTLKVPEGAIGLLGPNGAGKTTLLRILLGLARPTSGSATLLDSSVTQKNVEVHRHIGYMPEHECLVPTMNAVSFVSLMAMLNGLPRSDANQRAHEALHYVGIGDERYRLIKTYSTGMRQKVKFAQAVAHDPKVLFLDEPTNGMDPDGRNQILGLIRDIHLNHGKTIILSSHLLTDVEKVCGHVVVLNRGEVVLQGDLSALTGGDRSILDVKIKGDEKLFLSSLKKEGMKVRREGTYFQMDRKKDTLDRIVRLCAENDIQLRYANQSYRSLEDIFMEIVMGTSGKTDKETDPETGDAKNGGGEGAN